MSWKSKPSCDILASKDRTVQSELQRFIANHIAATVFKADSSHVPIPSRPDLVLEVIRKAPNPVQNLRQHKVHGNCFSEPEGSLGEAPLQTSVEFVCSYNAIVDALTATILNAQAGLNWLRAQPTDIEEVRRALNDVVTDAKRAGEIVVRLRPPMRMSPRADDALESLS